MRKYFVLVAIVTLFACSQKDKGFKITVDLEGAEGQVLLEKVENKKLVPVDTAEVVDGIAVFTGKVNYPQDYYLSVIGNRPKTILFMENNKINVTGNADSLAKVIVTGSKTHSEYKQVTDSIQKIGEEYMTLYKKAGEANSSGDSLKAKELMDKVGELYNSSITLQKDFVKNNPASYAAPYFLSGIQNRMDENELEKLVKSLDPKLDSLTAVINVKDRIKKLKIVAIGEIAPDFIMNDPEGNPIKFSDVYSKNEYTLLDFWASWCGSCRRENPNVVAVFNEYKDKGFGVFGVSLDRDKDSWKNAIKDDKLTWEHVSDLAYWKNAAAQLYVINSIPSNLIVDKNGKIIAKNKREEELRKIVSELVN